MITLTNAVTGKTTTLSINTAMRVGQVFRLIGRTTAFRAESVSKHPVCGLIVRGVSLDGAYRTAARVIDTAKVAA